MINPIASSVSSQAKQRPGTDPVASLRTVVIKNAASRQSVNVSDKGDVVR